MSLTLKQQKFINYYLGEANGNATKAAEKAGYAVPMQQGYENLRKPEIHEEISRRYAENAMPADEVLSRLGDQARGAGEFIRHLDGKRPYVDTEAMIRAGKGHLIKGIKYTNKGQVIVELHDAQNALINIGRHHKLFTDRLEGEMNLNLDDARETLNSKLAGIAARSGAPGVPEQSE